MSIVKGHCPLPNSFIATVNSLSLTHREKNLLKVIGEEIYRFPEGRESLSKELSSRFLEGLTGIKRNHISVLLNKFHSRGYIKYIKSHVKGQGSIIILTLGTDLVPDNDKLGTAIVHGDTKLGTVLVPNPKNLSKKEDLKKDDPDSLLKIKQAIEKKPMENSLNCLPDTKSFLTSSKKSNSNNLAVSLLCPPAAGATGKSEFFALGSVLPDVMTTPSPGPMVQAPAPPQVTALSDKAVIEGKKLLQEKGFTASQIQAITQRITDSIKKHTPKRPDSYFLAAINNEKIKPASVGSTAPVSRQVPPGTCAMVQVQNNSFTETVNRWEQEKKKDSPEETIKKLMELSPDDLYRVILDVDNSPASKFISLPEIKASLYIAEFKKRHPEVKV